MKRKPMCVVRAALARRAEAWRWGSLHRRLHGTPDERALLCEPPIALGRNWKAHVNRPQSAAEQAAIEQCLHRGRPYGGEAWQRKVAKQLNLQYTFRARGRPRKQPTESAR